MKLTAVFCIFIALSIVFCTSGCAGRPIQFRLTEPVVAPEESGHSNAPVARFTRQRRSHLVKADVARFTRQRGSHRVEADIVWENPDHFVNNRVNLRPRSVYDISIELPEDYEFRRMQLLEAKTETLYSSIENMEQRLSENSEQNTRLLSEAARAALIEDSVGLREEVAELNVHLVRAESTEARRTVQAQIDRAIEMIAEKEAMLRDDDMNRDSLLPPPMTESLINQVEDWRRDLGRLKARIVALELMAQNTNEPYPRVIAGLVETFDHTQFTRVGAVPLAIEDEYLDWLREDKVVTIVSYDPGEKPEDAHAARRRAELPRYWPRDSLMVVEILDSSLGSVRSAHGGVEPAAKVVRKNYFNVTATTFEAHNGYQRTYLNSEDSRKMWVFGPDVTPPTNVEVWVQDAHGLPIQQLYPSITTGSIHNVHVRQIAGVEGAAFDPVEEAKRRGRIIAVTRFGNIRRSGDSARIHRIYRNEMERSRARAGR